MNISSGAAPSHIQLCCVAPPRPMESKSEGKYAVAGFRDKATGVESHHRHGVPHEHTKHVE